MTVLDCPACDGQGTLTRDDPTCGCLYHAHAGAPCTCPCPHNAEECGFCDGIGQVEDPGGEWAG